MTENFYKTIDLTKQYESLRLSAENQQITQYQQEYFCFICKGMISWMVEIDADMLKKQKSITEKSPRMNLEGAFQPKQSQISQIITDILFKKIKEGARNDTKPRKSAV